MKTLELLCEKNDKGFTVKAPAVGCVTHLPGPGQILTASAGAGQLRVLGTVYRLKLPEQVAGKVKAGESAVSCKAVAYDEPLFALTSVYQQESVSTEETKSSQARVIGKNIISAPTDGVFYRRPSPDQPSYVEVGDTVKAGQVLGLIEVMKCFNQITFGGSAAASEAKILEICVADGCEVKYQQPLFLLG
jgi:biotin carboxyl carrier protein